MSPESMRARSIAVAFLLLPAVVAAQGLGEAARREKERRKGATVKTYGDEELKANPGRIANPGAVPSPSPSPSPGSTSQAAPTSPTPSPTAGSPDPRRPKPSASPSEPEKDESALRAEQEAKWRERAGTLRMNLARLERLVKDLEIEIETRETVFALGYEFTKLMERRKQLAQAREDLDRARVDWDSLEEEARRAAIPPGWLR